MPNQIETDRLVLRRREVDDAAVERQLWTERDPRVPPHRRVGPDGRPTVEDLASAIRVERDSQRVGVLTIVRKSERDVIGYCGLISDGRGSPGEPELAYELLRQTHGVGYATEAAGAVVAWAADIGYRRLWAGAWAWNVASLNVLHKLGFVDTRLETDADHGDTVVTVKTFLGTGR